jgi:S-adenosylmethionine:tRNA ribosyltransferase-isomerase
VNFNWSPAKTIKLSNLYGLVPVPPYIKILPDATDYQTIYAKVVGSVAAPTAGFHLTPSLLAQIKSMGVTIVEITLHVGLGTFQPIRTNNIKDHHMHSEWVEISENAAKVINNAKAEGRRVIAVGTTTVRALEGVAEAPTTNNLQPTTIPPYSGDVNLFITPGFQFKIVDGLLTNFHLPKSTLLLLVSAFAASASKGVDNDSKIDKYGRQRILAAYQEAIKHNYRFYSFGDAMFII